MSFNNIIITTETCMFIELIRFEGQKGIIRLSSSFKSTVFGRHHKGQRMNKCRLTEAYFLICRTVFQNKTVKCVKRHIRVPDGYIIDPTPPPRCVD